jgi:hypothetical protein
MDTRVQLIFLCEVREQCAFALLAFRNINATRGTEDARQFWFSVQPLLVAVANVSKILWPDSTADETRGPYLRRLLSVADDSAVRDRKLRNHFEHFDERLDRWVTARATENFVSLNFGVPTMFAGVAPADDLRNFDLANYAVTFYGEPYCLQPIRNELARIWGECEGQTKTAYRSLRQEQVR